MRSLSLYFWYPLIPLSFSLLSINVYELAAVFGKQTNFDAAVEPLEICKKKTGGEPKFKRAVYGEHLVGKVLTNFGWGLKLQHISSAVFVFILLFVYVEMCNSEACSWFMLLTSVLLLKKGFLKRVLLLKKKNHLFDSTAIRFSNSGRPHQVPL